LTAIQDPVLSKVVIETVLEKARVSVAGAFDAAFLHDLEVDNESLRRVEETLATLKLAQGVALNLATTYAHG
jgi:glycine cleavage system regulatory protein